jgi:hypothetical protein
MNYQTQRRTYSLALIHEKPNENDLPTDFEAARQSLTATIVWERAGERRYRVAKRVRGEIVRERVGSTHSL